MNLTDEDFAMLAQLERDMDSGAKPHVVHGGERLAVEPAMMTSLGLVSGQTISHVMFGEILRRLVADCQAQIIIRDAQGGAV